LPILSTLEGLVATGDRIRAIDGVLSGTLNAVLAGLEQGDTVATAVRSAFDAGLTEPHPWEDLCGLDVARKLIILARGAGRLLELEDLVVEPLLPGGGGEALDLEAFWRRLPEANAALARRIEQARSRGRRLRYLARLEGDQARVGLFEIEPSHPAWELSGPDNLVSFTTDRYADRPLVIRGPGAGPRVTAAGLVADLLRVAR
jgi:homoserine dehydrogenase